MKKILYVFAATALLVAVTVSCKKKVTEVKLNQTELELVRGETATLAATVSPNDADNPNVSWASSNNDIATVDNNGQVTAISHGTAVITVTTEEGNKTATCSVVVFHPAEPKMVTVEGGTFWMGCTEEQEGSCEGNELPKHQVTLSKFKMSVTEITQEQWKMIMGSYNPSLHVSSALGLPVENITWNEVQEYIARLNDTTGKHYRLPTEAEWEYAARGGNKSKGYKFSGSNDTNEVAWYFSNSGNETHPVATKAPNELGLYDMSGNVLEWCSDWYANSDPYPSTPQKDPQGPSESGKQYKVNRGGWFNGLSSDLRVSNRKYSTGGKNYNSSRWGTIGFRLVLSG